MRTNTGIKVEIKDETGRTIKAGTNIRRGLDGRTFRVSSLIDRARMGDREIVLRGRWIIPSLGVATGTVIALSVDRPGGDPGDPVSNPIVAVDFKVVDEEVSR